ncbi:MAG: crossover junction endodeoxyribonuclease RuvC, partial [Patescibacteria group bacterium]|nr:crossover junction endodeoxyribonuclease RuvC [Patescibacteria group bacterium]
MAVEKVFVPPNRSRLALVNVFVSEIRAIAKRKKIRCVWYAPSTVKKFICGYGWADKEKVAQCVALYYPELKVYLTQDRA